MDRHERINDTVTALQSAQKGWQQKLWTALPCIVQSFDATKMTVVAQPAIRAQIRSPDVEGTWTDVTLPLCLDCPVVFPGGGGFGVTFPVSGGDEGLLVFSSRCIDSWWQSGGVQSQAEFRMHDLSDGFFVPGAFSVPRVPANVSTTAARFWKNDGTMYAELGPDGVLTLKAPVRIVLDAPVTHVTGGLAVSGTMSGQVAGGGTIDMGSSDLVTTGDITSNNVGLDSHTHPQSGGGNTGPPNS